MQVMEIIQAYDGDVMKFAGDSVIVAFYPTAAEREERDAGLKRATMRCARCSASLIENCGKQKVAGSNPAKGSILSG